MLTTPHRALQCAEWIAARCNRVSACLHLFVFISEIQRLHLQTTVFEIGLNSSTNKGRTYKERTVSITLAITHLSFLYNIGIMI